MKIQILNEEELYKVINEEYNPPLIQNQKEENLFQVEIRTLYNKLIECLSYFGEEGDYYGVSDFAVRPSLKEFPTVMVQAPHIKQFTLTIITEEFFRSDYLRVLHQFLSTEAPAYRVWIDQDFNSDWIQTIFLTADLAQVYCTNPDELSRVTSILNEL